ncbi:MAG TPA: CUAEP/CCAEP-tail radical SAM protein [Blastocatellia bacterium]|nr:CUAEP/CCAEP-tail radical SAM protein [Blastocatellia bacterium]
MSERAFTVLLVSGYELGHQPAGLAVPLGFLRRAGIPADAIDISVQGFDETRVRAARFVGVSVPMHTALRLGVRIAERVRLINPDCHICFYGMYATLNADYLLDTVADSVIGGEAEEELVALVKAVAAGEVNNKQPAALPVLARLDFPLPERGNLAPLERYARLAVDGQERLAGYTEASRGCLHHCTHCPIPPVYGGRFFVVPQEVVMADVRQQVAAGARHITFGDPDFLNGPTHALRIARQLHAEFPDVTFDFTAKIEHLLKHRALLPALARAGCLFVVSAVESLSDMVLARLDKGHTRADVDEALRLLGEAGIALRPSFVAFTPWTTLDDYLELLEFVESRHLIDHVDPVQFSIRLLVPPGSLLLKEAGAWLGPLNQQAFTYEWQHPDLRMDELHGEVTRIVEQAVQRNEDAAATFARIGEAAYARRGAGEVVKPLPVTAALRRRPPRLTEAWFC